MKPATRQKYAWLLALTVGALWHACAQAQTSIMIWPLDPVIEEDQRAVAMWLENRGTQTTSLQVRVLAWSQTNGEESYESQEIVVPSPPTATIAPGQRQLVRLMKTQSAPEGRELAYRVLVDELPAAAGANEGAAAARSSMGIKLQMRYSVPLFVSGKGHWFKPRADRKREPSSAAQAALSWRTEREGADYFLVVRNAGAAHARMSAVNWVRGDETRTINPGLLGYVLADTQMRWRLESAPPAGFTLQSRINAGDTATVLVAQ